jgi:hypothetical protein
VVASIFESGAVYYPMILLLPIVTGVVLGRWRPERHWLWILLAVVFAFLTFDFALDETRSEDIPFFVVLGIFMFSLGLLARALTRRLLRRRVPA